VRVLVQNKATRQFLRAPHGWTRNEPEAIDFKKTVSAIEHCVRQRIADAQLILTFEADRSFDIIVPIRNGETKPKLSAA